MGSQNISLKTETERLLYKHYSEEKAEREKLQILVKDLKDQLSDLHQRLKITQEQLASVSKQAAKDDPPAAVEYETDEEELAKETGWIRQRSRKKRKFNTSLSPPSQGSTVIEKTKEKKTPPPPPIIVENIKDYQKFYDLLLTVLPKESFTTKIMKDDRVKVNSTNEEAYKSVSNLLHQNNCYSHTYENKQNRPIRVMAKNFPLLI